LWFFRYRLFQSDSYLLELDILRLDRLDDETLGSGKSVLAFVDESIQHLQSQVSGTQLVNALDLAVQRLRLNRSFHEANEVATEACDLHLELLNSRLSISKYILWAIPSIGFLGTVRGISEALTKAHEAMQGDISGIGASLGVAFNSTYVALFLSLVLMLISNTLQGREERLVARFKHFISTSFIPVLSAKLTEETEAQTASEDPAIE
jgi:biopolymer transport protein ExbB/TolQ